MIMAKDLWDVILLFLLAAILCPIVAIQLKQGKMKTAFIPLPINPEIPVDWPYGLWPVGVGSFLAGTGIFVESRTLILIGLFGAILFAFVFMFWKPRWLKPDWLLWLEDHYDQSTIDFMFDQARQDKSWSRRISTQEGLEAWAREMEQKYRSYMGNGYG
jgi:hypothetical protein